MQKLEIMSNEEKERGKKTGMMGISQTFLLEWTIPGEGSEKEKNIMSPTDCLSHIKDMLSQAPAGTMVEVFEWENREKGKSIYQGGLNG